MTLVDLNDEGDEIILEDVNHMRIQPSMINILDPRETTGNLQNYDLLHIKNAISEGPDEIRSRNTLMANLADTRITKRIKESDSYN